MIITDQSRCVPHRYWSITIRLEHFRVLSPPTPDPSILILSQCFLILSTIFSLSSGCLLTGLLAAFFRLWWSWIIAIIQKEKGRRKRRKEGGGIERDTRSAARSIFLTWTWCFHRGCMYGKKNKDYVWHSQVEIRVMKEENRGQSWRQDCWVQFLKNKQYSITGNDSRSNVTSRVP